MPITAGGGGGAGDPEEATPRVLAAVTAALERLVERNEGIAAAAATEKGEDGEEEEAMAAPLGGPLDGFRGVKAPSISVGRYLKRIYRYTGCSPSCFVVGFAYVDRLAHRHPSSLVVSVNVHRLILTSVMVASKVLDDVHHNNAFYAKVGGVSNTELNRMELELLFLLDFGVTVSSHVFESYCLHLEKELLSGGGGVAAGDRRRGAEGNHLGTNGGGDDAEAPAAAEDGEHDAPQSCASLSSPPHSF